MDVLFSFIQCMMWMCVGAAWTLMIQDWIKDWKKMKAKKQAPLTSGSKGQLYMLIDFVDKTNYFASVEASRKTSPFRIKSWRRMYRWFFTKTTPLFALRTMNRRSGCFEYFAFRREDIKTIRFIWQPNE